MERIDQKKCYVQLVQPSFPSSDVHYIHHHKNYWIGKKWRQNLCILSVNHKTIPFFEYLCLFVSVSFWESFDPTNPHSFSDPPSSSFPSLFFQRTFLTICLFFYILNLKQKYEIMIIPDTPTRSNLRGSSDDIYDWVCSSPLIFFLTIIVSTVSFVYGMLIEIMERERMV